MKSDTLSKHQTAWMQQVPLKIYYYKCRCCEMMFTSRELIAKCFFCPSKDVVRIPECAFRRKRPGRGPK